MVRQLLLIERPMTADWPAVAGIDPAVYVIPTDAPEADGTLAWNETTMVLVTAQCRRPRRDRLELRGGGRR